MLTPCDPTELAVTARTEAEQILCELQRVDRQERATVETLAELCEGAAETLMRSEFTAAIRIARHFTRAGRLLRTLLDHWDPALIAGHAQTRSFVTHCLVRVAPECSAWLRRLELERGRLVGRRAE